MLVIVIVIVMKYHKFNYRRIPQAAPFTCRAVAQKLETQNQKEDQISIRTTLVLHTTPGELQEIRFQVRCQGRLPPILSAALRAVLRLVFSHGRV